MKKTRLLFVALLGFISLSMQAQQVSGIVLDEDDNPIPGVNVIVEGQPMERLPTLMEIFQ